MTSNKNWLNGKVVGLSVSDSDDLAGLGFGREHMREVLLGIAQSVLRRGADLAYGGHFKKKGSFTRDLILLISQEQREDSSDQEHWNGILYNHSPWPYYEDITDENEAEYIDACRFVKITRDMAGIVPEKDAKAATRVKNAHMAIVLSTMRRIMAEGTKIQTAAPGISEEIPPVSARVLIGGKTKKFTGMLPGLFEEALYCLERHTPLFLVGGFGGAAAKLAGYMNKSLSAHDAGLDLDELRRNAPALSDVEAAFEKYHIPESIAPPSVCLERLLKQLGKARTSMARALNNGLTAKQNKILFQSTDASEAAALILQGLKTNIARSKPKPTPPSKKTNPNKKT